MMSSLSPVEMREKYREEAALFLIQSTNKEFYENEKDVKRKQSDDESLITINTARSLILRSMYAEPQHNGVAVRHDFYCLCCGNALLPMGLGSDIVPNITLKSLKRSKTRRRRSSRKKSKKIAFDTNVLQKHRGGGRTFARQSATDSHGSTVDSVMGMREVLKKRHALSTIRDGGGKNCISYRCSKCGYEKLFKGLQPKNKDAEGDKVTKRGHGVGKKPFRTSVKGSQSLISNSETGFISLGASCKTPTRKLKALEQGRKKKRQKKTKSTELSEFLSSLND